MHSTTTLQYLKKLHSLLNYGHPGVEFSFGIPYLHQLSLGAVLLVNMILSPYILFLLLRLEKWGWLVFFSILMAVFAGFSWLLGSFGGPWEIVTGSFFFLFLALFMWALRLRVNDWHSEALHEMDLRMKKCT